MCTHPPQRPRCDQRWPRPSGCEGSATFQSVVVAGQRVHHGHDAAGNAALAAPTTRAEVYPMCSLPRAGFERDDRGARELSARATGDARPGSGLCGIELHRGVHEAQMVPGRCGGVLFFFGGMMGKASVLCEWIRRPWDDGCRRRCHTWRYTSGLRKSVMCVPTFRCGGGTDIPVHERNRSSRSPQPALAPPLPIDGCAAHVIVRRSTRKQPPVSSKKQLLEVVGEKSQKKMLKGDERRRRHNAWPHHRPTAAG